MSDNAREERDKKIREIEQEITKHRAQIDTSQQALDNMRDNPDMLADAGVRENGRIRNAQEAIEQLEEERRSLQRA